MNMKKQVEVEAVFCPSSDKGDVVSWKRTLGESVGYLKSRCCSLACRGMTLWDKGGGREPGSESGLWYSKYQGRASCLSISI